MLFGALGALQLLVHDQPLLLLECSSLPLLVHAAAGLAYAKTGGGGGGGSTFLGTASLSAHELQESVANLVFRVHRAAQAATSPAAAAATAMWETWALNPPAGLSLPIAGGSVAAAVAGGAPAPAPWDRMAAAAGLMEHTGPRPLPGTAGYAAASAAAAGLLGGGHAAGTAASAQRLVGELVHAANLMGE